MKVLVVEDDPSVAQALQLLLARYNYAVDLAADGEAGLQMAEAFEYDLLLLDVMLPKLDGVGLCQQLRAKGFQCPILLLTGQGGGRQKAIALNAGADDYVIKPFDAEELVARIQALMRRGWRTSQPVLSWGQLSVDPNSRKAAYGTHLLAITPKEYAILELFLRTPQTVLSSRLILDHVWTSVDCPGEETVRVHIKMLRQKLATAGAPKDFIKTKHREGYQLNPRYSNFLATQVEHQPMNPQIAELTVVNEELRLALEELQVVEEEVRQQNEELEVTRQTLELERQRYHDLFECAPIAYVVTDTQGVIQEANRLAAELFRVTVQWLTGKPLAVFIANPDRSDFRLRLATFNFAQDWEINLQPKEGAPCPVLVAVTSIKNLQNQIVGLRWSLHDISFRKATGQQLQTAHDQLEIRAAELKIALRQGEEQLSLALELNSIGLWDWHLESGAVTWNANYYRLLGYQPGEVKPTYQHWRDRVHPDDIALIEQKLAQSLETQTNYEEEFRVILEDGSIRWLLGKGRGVYDEAGQPVRMKGVVFDISDRKQAEAALQSSEEQRRLALDLTGTASWDWNLITGNVVWSDNMFHLLGLTPSGVSPTYTVWRNCVHPEDLEGLEAAVTLHLQNRTIYSEEYRVVYPDGSVHWLLSKGQGVYNAAGQAVRMVGVTFDITEKKQLEAQFYRAQRLESLGTLASGIAHDLNNALVPIRAAPLLLRTYQADLNEDSQKLLQMVENNAKRAADMVKQILTFVRGTGEEREPLQVTPLLQEVTNVIQQTFPKSIQICEIIPAQPPDLVSANPTYLHQVLMNLCVNARDAMPKGGVLTLSVENFEVDEIFASMNLDAQVGDYVVMTVGDTGIGIPPEVRDRIFDPFFTTKETGKGTGLGLSTVLGIVKDYGGFVQVASEVGQGSQFKVYLPVIEATIAPTTASEPLLHGQGELVLLVDDDPAVQQTNQSLLESHHYTTLVANDGTAAIALYTQHQHEIQVVVMDVMMPNMDGISAVRALRQINPAVKILAISGLSSNRDLVLAAGAKSFLPKPYLVEDLLRCLHDLMTN